MNDLPGILGLAVLVLTPLAILLGWAHARLVHRLSTEASHATAETGEWARALAASRWLRRLAPERTRLLRSVIDSAAHRGLCDPGRALEGLALGDLHDLIPRANAVVDLYISIGRYREALAILPPVLARLAGLGGPAADLCTLLEINAAEAEYNQGRWAEAEARMLRPEARRDESPICRAGSRQQLAWILAHRGEAERALALCAESRVEDLPGVYHAEFHYSRATALLAAGRLDEAEEAIRVGASVAKRPSSARNALYLLARVAALRLDWVEVEALCRRGADHGWQHQGGDGLLLWGDALLRLGRAAEATEAWRLALERDPESESAAAAHGRLATPGTRAG